MKHHHHDISVGKISHSFFGGIALFVDVITLSSTNMYYTRIVCPYYDDDKRHDKRNDSSRKMQRVHTVRTVRNDRSAHNPPNLRDGGSRSARAYCRPAYVPYRTVRTEESKPIGSSVLFPPPARYWEPRRMLLSLVTATVKQNYEMECRMYCSEYF